MMIVLCGCAFFVLCASYGVRGLNANGRTPRMNSKFSKEGWDQASNDSFPTWSNFLKRSNITDEENEILDELDPKIVNGRRANEGEFPWMVALHYNDRFVCSSFLISPTIVMTAAHCVKFGDSVEPASAFYGIIGNVRREGPDTRITFREVAAHPRYGPGSEYDIAVFRTSAPVTLNDRIKTICIPTGDSELQINNIQAMGWGVTSTSEREAPEVLMTTDLNVIGEGSCSLFFSALGITITEKHICVNSFKSTGVCFGDSGGPGVLNDRMLNQPVAVGVASFITFLGCGRPVVPNVYTRISSYIDWLTEIVGSTDDICFV